MNFAYLFQTLELVRFSNRILLMSAVAIAKFNPNERVLSLFRLFEIIREIMKVYFLQPLGQFLSNLAQEKHLAI